MRRIDLQNWPRRSHYEFYKLVDQPHFNMCASVDVTAFYSEMKAREVAFTVAVLYLLARAANDIPAFRTRMRGGDVVEHEVIHPSTTILGDDGMFGFCTVGYAADLLAFAPVANAAIAAAKQHASIEEDPNRDDVYYSTVIPWVSFTSFAHPTHLHPVDSIPRFAWGKRFEEGGRMKMPLSVQGHHALMDGLHMGQFYERTQAYLSAPAQLFTAG